jgi:hypothetical protein
LLLHELHLEFLLPSCIALLIARLHELHACVGQLADLLFVDRSASAA